jgi:hypothetical protein
MVESGSRSFEMHEVQPRVLERVVEWLYSGEVGEISGVAEGLALLEGSRFLRVERMEAQCSAWVCAHVEASNCLAVWAEASRLGCGVVVERVLLVVGRRLAAVAGEAEFLGLSREALLELVRSEGLGVRSERAVYEAVMGWVRHDVGSRKVWLGEVLGAVRMALLPLEYLVETVGVDPLVTESFETLRIFAEASRLCRLEGAARAAAESDGRLRKRKHASGGELVVVGGDDYSGSYLKSVEVYDVSAGQWRALPDMSVARYGCAAVCIEGNVYVMGGNDGGTFFKSAEMYDTSATSGQWRALPDMSVERSTCAAVFIDGNVYVMGGYDGRSNLKSAEMYDTSAGQWRALPDMSVARGGCAAVCIEGKVYVIGGGSARTVCASMACFDPIANEWRTLPSITSSSARVFCAAVACNV